MLGSALITGILTERSPPHLLESGRLQLSHLMHGTHGGGSGGEFLCADYPQYTSNEAQTGLLKTGHTS